MGSYIPKPDVITAYNYSGMLDASALVHTGSGRLGGVIILTDGTYNATVTVYDKTSSGTDPEMAFPTMTTKGSENYGGGMFPFPIKYSTGLYVVISGTNAKCEVYYLPD